MMNEKKSFIIEDLDSHHLVIKADEEYRVREELSQEVTSQPLSPPSILANPDILAGEKHVQPGIMILYCLSF